MSLSLAQKALSASSLAAASVSSNAQAQTGPSITIAGKIDSHTKEGQSDARGDEKWGTIVVRDGHMVYAVQTGILTPQFDKQRKSRDTASIMGTVGYETNDFGVYASAGQLNGRVLRKWQDFVTARHGGTARISEASSKARIGFGISARVDEDLNVATLGNTKIDIDGAFFAHARTDMIMAGASAFISVNGGADPDFRPDLPGLPLRNQNTSYSFYGGITATARAYDLPTDDLGTKFMKFSVVAGASLRKGRMSMGAELQKDIRPEVDGPKMKTPISRIAVKVGFDF
jgi:hypothetical protein